MQVQRRLVVLVVLLASLVIAAPASAGIWTPVTSGTTADISAVDYVAAGNLVYGTTGGAILKNGTVTKTADAFAINDIAFTPSGTTGIAVANNGRMWRSVNGGASWTAVSLANSTFPHSSPCSGSGGPYTRTAAPTGNINAIAWGSETVGYAVGNDLGVVLKTTDGGATWTDVSRQSDGTCRVGTPGNTNPLTDVTALNDSLVWVVDDYFGQRWISSDGIASAATLYGNSSVNCYAKRPRLAVDRDNPNRSFATDRCNGTLQFGFSEDGGNNYELSQTFGNGDPSTLLGLNDVAIAGGSALAVGNTGAILVDNDGRNVYFQKADAPLAAVDWLSVDKLDAANAVVGGKGGNLITSTTANAIPDIVAPAGTISGPATATAGAPTTYTANVADNTGGSGIDPSSFAWSATGVPNATGNPVALTFPSAGFYTVSVTFKDLAGNTGTATLGVTVRAATAVSPTKTAKATVPGATISLGVPNTCVAPGSTFKVTLTWKRQKRKGNRFVKVRRADFYIGSKRVKIDTKAPFVQRLTVTAGAKSGSTIKLRARAYIKVSRGKSPTKSINTTVKVC